MSYGDDSRSAGSHVVFTYFVQSAIPPKWYPVTFVWDTFWYPLPPRPTAHVVDQWLSQTSITHCAADIYTVD